jgi:predicted DNA-binding transcriptional regulator AlpA
VKCACPCGKEFEPRRSNQRYLNAEHRQKDKNRRWPRKRQSLSPAPLRNALGAHRKARASGVPPLLGTQMAQAKLHAIVGLPAAKSAELLTISEVAHLLRISRWGLWNWRRRGSGPPYLKLSRGVVRYPRRVLADWLNQHVLSNVSDGGTVGQCRPALRD